LFSVASYASTTVHSDDSVYSPTVKIWKSVVESVPFGSTSWLWSLPVIDDKHKNKNRDSILWVPDESNSNDITLIVWLHGCNGFTEKTFRERLAPQILVAVEDKKSIALAIPEMPWSHNTFTRCGRQGKVWSSDYTLEMYVQEATAYLKSWSLKKTDKALGIVRVVIVGHSAGGSAIMSASEEGSLCRIDPEMVIWSDSTYSNWLSRAWKGCLRDSNISVRIIVRKWDRPWRQSRKFMNRLDANYPRHNVTLDVMSGRKWRHGRIGNEALWITDLFDPGC